MGLVFSFLLCFVGGIFRFANFPSEFAKFLGFVGFLVWIGLLDRGICLDFWDLLGLVYSFFFFAFNFIDQNSKHIFWFGIFGSLISMDGDFFFFFRHGWRGWATD